MQAGKRRLLREGYVPSPILSTFAPLALELLTSIMLLNAEAEAPLPRTAATWPAFTETFDLAGIVQQFHSKMYVAVGHTNAARV